MTNKLFQYAAFLIA